MISMALAYVVLNMALFLHAISNAKQSRRLVAFRLYSEHSILFFIILSLITVPAGIVALLDPRPR